MWPNRYPLSNLASRNLYVELRTASPVKDSIIGSSSHENGGRGELRAEIITSSSEEAEANADYSIILPCMRRASVLHMIAVCFACASKSKTSNCSRSSGRSHDSPHITLAPIKMHGQTALLSADCGFFPNKVLTCSLSWRKLRSPNADVYQLLYRYVVRLLL